MNAPMNLYKVDFEDNKAISSSKIDFDGEDHIKFEDAGDNYTIKWITIYANDTQNSIKAANDVARNILSLL